MADALPLLRSTRPPARRTHLAARWINPNQVVAKCGDIFNHPGVREWDGGPDEVTCRGCRRRVPLLDGEDGA